VLMESDKVLACPLSGCFSRRIVLYKYNILDAPYLCLFQSDEGEVNQSKEIGNDNPGQDDEPFAFGCCSSNASGSALQGDEAEAYQCVGNAPDQQTLGEPSMHASCNIEVCILCYSSKKKKKVCRLCWFHFKEWQFISIGPVKTIMVPP
jgi:hypothetical protein